MKLFEIWIEGYAATGESGVAHKIGEWEAKTFEEACRNFVYPDDIETSDPNYKIPAKGTKLKLDLKPDGSLQYARPSIWACRLYDNEADVRKSFG